jgi:hypothetical protein
VLPLTPAKNIRAPLIVVFENLPELMQLAGGQVAELAVQVGGVGRIIGAAIAPEQVRHDFFLLAVEAAQRLLHLEDRAEFHLSRSKAASRERSMFVMGATSSYSRRVPRARGPPPGRSVFPAPMSLVQSWAAAGAAG